jgi:hypothetical protein
MVGGGGGLLFDQCIYIRVAYSPAIPYLSVVLGRKNQYKVFFYLQLFIAKSARYGIELVIFV